MSYFEKSGGIYLVSDPTDGIKFQIWPDNISDQKSVNWSMIDVIGRSEPLPVYHSSSPQDFSFTLMFVSSVDQADGGSPEEVNRKVRFLKSLVYPLRARAGFSTHPPLVYLIVGEAINSRCVVKSVKTNYTGPWNIASPDNSTSIGELLVSPEAVVLEPYVDLPISVSVSIVLSAVHSAPLDHLGVKRNGETRTDYPRLSEVVMREWDT